MRCPRCHAPDTRVLDSRPTDEGTAIRRRRECQVCGERFTTREKVEVTPLWVIKRDGRRELFNRDKVLRGMLIACEKRPVELDQLQAIASDVERELYRRFDNEVESRVIGEMVMERLQRVDQVAYVRFASVYRQFRDLETFRRELDRLLAGEPPGTARASQDAGAAQGGASQGAGSVPGDSRQAGGARANGRSVPGPGQDSSAGYRP